jgi:hypothetical protein
MYKYPKDFSNTNWYEELDNKHWDTDVYKEQIAKIIEATNQQEMIKAFGQPPSKKIKKHYMGEIKKFEVV